MRKKNILLILSAAMVSLSLLTGCGNRQMMDTTYRFQTAVIAMPDGTFVAGKVEGWKDYDDSGAIQVKIDGKTYYTFLGNVVLINE